MTARDRCRKLVRAAQLAPASFHSPAYKSGPEDRDAVSKPWRDYAKGDLLYGLAQNRGQLAQFMGIKAGDLYTIDQYGIMSDATAPTLLKNNLTFDQEGTALKTDSHLYRYLYTELSDGNIIA